MNELQTIDLIKRVTPAYSKNVKVGIGDDAAVIRVPSKNLVVTVDSLVEGVHFDFAYSTPEQVGHKAIAVNLSDIAAMGAKPLYAVVSLGLKFPVKPEFIRRLYAGIVALAKKNRTEIVGGNLTRTPDRFFIDVTLIGEASRPVLRSGAKPGDRLAVTHTLGASAAGLECLRRNIRKFPLLIRSHLMPIPRLKESQILKESANAMIDVSDGLASDLFRLLEKSKVGAILLEENIPMHPQLIQCAQELKKDPLHWALYGGEDYELLFAVPEKKWKTISGKLPITSIGTITNRRGEMILKHRSGMLEKIKPRGWDHFA